MGSTTSEACFPDSVTLDFTGCTDGYDIIDSSNYLRATPQLGATCSSEGITINGEDGYVDITKISSSATSSGWAFGGATTIEMYVRYDQTSTNAKVLYFGSDANFSWTDSDDEGYLALGNHDVNDSIRFTVNRQDVTSTAQQTMWTGEIGRGAKRRAEKAIACGKNRTRSHFSPGRASFVTTALILTHLSNPFRDSLRSSQTPLDMHLGASLCLDLRMHGRTLS